MPRLLSPGRPSRIAVAVRNHDLHPPSWRRENATPAMPSTTGSDNGRAQRPRPAPPLWCREYVTPAMPCTTGSDSGRAQNPPRCAPRLVSSKCHACYALDDRHG
eukprot:2386473-Pyramimonas_sp.AAC.1